jgi:hypothetical protein
MVSQFVVMVYTFFLDDILDEWYLQQIWSLLQTDVPMVTDQQEHFSRNDQWFLYGTRKDTLSQTLEGSSS